MKYTYFLIALLLTHPCFSKEKVVVGIAANFSALNDTMWNVHANHFRNGINLAIEDAKDAFKNKPYDIVLQEFDYGNEKLGALRVASEAVKSQAVAVIGFPYSSEVLLAGSIFNENKLLLFSPSATADRIGQLGKYVRTCVFSDSQQGQILSSVAQNSQLKRVAILSVSDCAYCQSLHNAFKKDFESHGGKVIADETLLEDQVEQSAMLAGLLKRLKGKQLDAVFLPNYERVSATLIASLYDRGIRPRLWLGGDGWGGVSDLFSKILEKRPITALTIAHWHSGISKQKSKRFQEAYITKFGKEPNDIAAVSYDAMTLLLKSIAQTKTVNRKNVVESLESNKEFEGLISSIRYQNGSRTPVKAAVLLKLNNGIVTYLNEVE